MTKNRTTSGISYLTSAFFLGVSIEQEPLDPQLQQEGTQPTSGHACVRTLVPLYTFLKICTREILRKAAQIPF